MPCTLELPPLRGSFGEGHIVEPQPGKPFTGVYFLEAREGTCVVGIDASVLRDSCIGASVIRDMAWPADSGFRTSVLTDTAHPQASTLQASPCQLRVRAHGRRRLEAQPQGSGVCGARRAPAGGGVGGPGKVLWKGRVSERPAGSAARLDGRTGRGSRGRRHRRRVRAFVPGASRASLTSREHPHGWDWRSLQPRHAVGPAAQGRGPSGRAGPGVGRRARAGGGGTAHALTLAAAPTRPAQPGSFPPALFRAGAAARPRAAPAAPPREGSARASGA